MEKINVLIVDDSAIVREILTKKLSEHPQINVVGAAPDPFIARDKIEKNKVDVITLDIEMPRMDGLTFLKYLMKYNPMPVIIVSSLTDKSNKSSMEALELGAIDIVPKPGGPFSIEEVIDSLIEKILGVKRIDNNKLKLISEKIIKTTENKPKIKYLSTIETTDRIIAVGTSTGGTQALEVLFKSFDYDFPATLAVIHMPEKFTFTFAKRLNDISPMNVKEAQDGEKITNGTIYIAPGNYHMLIKTIGKDKYIKTATGPKVHNQRPAVDVLFNSVSENIGQNTIGVILTGMGRDGADGLLKIKNAGGYTISQDEESSIVFGMPKEAILLGAADTVLPLTDIAGKIKTLLKK
jgi:two-component system, chemotaxis family, protein-glutamate methylesterase/glutaminase